MVIFKLRNIIFHPPWTAAAAPGGTKVKLGKVCSAYVFKLPITASSCSPNSPEMYKFYDYEFYTCIAKECRVNSQFVIKSEQNISDVQSLTWHRSARSHVEGFCTI